MTHNREHILSTGSSPKTKVCSHRVLPTRSPSGMRGCAQSVTLWQQPTIETTSGVANPKFFGAKNFEGPKFWFKASNQRWARIRTGSDCNFFEDWRIRTGSDWENIFFFIVTILNVSKILVVIPFYRLAKWQCNFAINDKSSAEAILPFELHPPLPKYNVEF